MVAALQQQLGPRGCPQQEVDQLIQQTGGAHHSDDSTEDGGGDQDHLLAPGSHRHTCESEHNTCAHAHPGPGTHWDGLTCPVAEEEPFPVTTAGEHTELAAALTPANTHTHTHAVCQQQHYSPLQGEFV